MEITTKTSSAGLKPVSKRSPNAVKNSAAVNVSLAVMTLSATMVPSVAIGESSKVPVMFIAAESATIKPNLVLTSNSGPVEMALRTVSNDDLADTEDEAIARMSTEEVLAEVMAAQGIWADRDDLDDLLDRSDRIDDLYGFLDGSDASL